MPVSLFESAIKKLNQSAATELAIMLLKQAVADYPDLFNFLTTWPNDSNRLTGISLTQYINNNKLTEIDLSLVSNLLQLELSGNQLTYAHTADLKKLTQLNLSRNLLSSINFFHKSVLQGLDLSNNQFSDIDLTDLKDVIKLNLHKNQLSSIRGLEKLKNLFFLVVSENPALDCYSLELPVVLSHSVVCGKNTEKQIASN